MEINELKIARHRASFAYLRSRARLDISKLKLFDLKLLNHLIISSLERRLVILYNFSHGEGTEAPSCRIHKPISDAARGDAW